MEELLEYYIMLVANKYNNKLMSDDMDYSYIQLDDEEKGMVNVLNESGFKNVFNTFSKSKHLISLANSFLNLNTNNYYYVQILFCVYFMHHRFPESENVSDAIIKYIGKLYTCVVFSYSDNHHVSYEVMRILTNILVEDKTYDVIRERLLQSRKDQEKILYDFMDVEIQKNIHYRRELLALKEKLAKTCKRRMIRL